MPNWIRNRSGKSLATTLAPRSRRSSAGQVNALWKGVNKPSTIEYLVVAGGAGGGSGGNANGGGGSGGARTGSLSVSSGQNLTVTIGGGGSGTGYGYGGTGGNSQLGPISATGGGAGAPANANNNGASGGSGGGGANATGNGPPGYGGAGNAGGYTPAEGSNGGNSSSDNNTYRNGGGGGSAALASTLANGTSVTYAYGGVQGGNCCAYTGNQSANTGNGGIAGSNIYNIFSSFAGGSGIVVLAYSAAFDDIKVGAGLTFTKNVTGGLKRYVFTSGTGTVTI